MSEVQPKGFDYRSIIADPKTGKVIRQQHYIFHIQEGLGQFLERDGKFYHPGSNTEEIRDPRLPPIETVLAVDSSSKPEVKPEKKTSVIVSKA
jgi:hypothetical protein